MPQNLQNLNTFMQNANRPFISFTNLLVIGIVVFIIYHFGLWEKFTDWVAEQKRIKKAMRQMATEIQSGKLAHVEIVETPGSAPNTATVKTSSSVKPSMTVEEKLQSLVDGGMSETEAKAYIRKKIDKILK